MISRSTNLNHGRILNLHFNVDVERIVIALHAQVPTFPMEKFPFKLAPQVVVFFFHFKTINLTQFHWENCFEKLGKMVIKCILTWIVSTYFAWWKCVVYFVLRHQKPKIDSSSHLFIEIQWNVKNPFSSAEHKFTHIRIKWSSFVIVNSHN